MPTENELKFVLSNEPSLESSVRELANNGGTLIEQGYLCRKSKICVRLRKSSIYGSDDVHYYMQTKCRAAKNHDGSKGRVIEITADIDQRDFNDMWKRAKGKLTKIRYLIHSETTDRYTLNGRPWQEIWEVDFFKSPSEKNYFVMAEVEIPEEAQLPLFEVPEVIRKNTVFRVPLWDSRFSNSRIGNISYATKLYRSLLSNKKRKTA